MLSEDGLLLVVVLVACALVVLGTLELVWPTRARHPHRRAAAARDPWRRARSRTAPPPRHTVAAAAPRSTDPPLSPRDVSVASSVTAPAEREDSLVDRGFALLKAERFGEAMMLGEQALKAAKSSGISVPTTGASRETARCWGLVGLAKEGLDDVEDARFAFEEAIALAPGTDRPTWERHLAALALAVGRRSLGGVETGSSAERIASLRSAIDWLERGLAVSPGDADLHGTLGAARDALWSAREAVLEDLVRRRAFTEARRVLDDVMGDPECPPERRPAFHRLLGRTMSGEARQAVAESVRHTQGGRVHEAMAALTRAESLIGAIPTDALGGKRRRELKRRVWSGYMKLGVSRVEAGD